MSESLTSPVNLFVIVSLSLFLTILNGKPVIAFKAASVFVAIVILLSPASEL